MRKFIQHLLVLKFSRLSIITINLIIGNLILFFTFVKDESGQLYSGLPAYSAYSVASILILFVSLHLTVNSKLGNSIIALIATLFVPVIGTIFLYRDFIAGLMSSFIGIIAFPRYWIPMAVLNIFLFIRYEKIFQAAKKPLTIESISNY